MKAVVQKLLNFLLFMYLGAIFVLFRSGLDMSLHLRMFLFSSLPLLAMLNGLYKAKLPFREIRKRRGHHCALSGLRALLGGDSVHHTHGGRLHRL